MNPITLMAREDEVPVPSIALNDGPDSMLAMLPPKVGSMIEEALFTHPDLFNKSESDLFHHLRENRYTPTPSDNRLRMKFWMEYDSARAQGRKKINIENVLAGICYREYFYTHYLTKPAKLAWMVCMPTGYITKTMEALEFGIDQIRDILAMDPAAYGAKSAPSILALKQKIVEMLHAWVKGAPVQRTVAVNMNTTRTMNALATDASMDDLQRRLEELETKTELAKNLPLDIGPGDLD